MTSLIIVWRQAIINNFFLHKNLLMYFRDPVVNFGRIYLLTAKDTRDTSEKNPPSFLFLVLLEERKKYSSSSLLWILPASETNIKQIFFSRNRRHKRWVENSSFFKFAFYLRSSRQFSKEESNLFKQELQKGKHRAAVRCKINQFFFLKSHTEYWFSCTIL